MQRALTLKTASAPEIFRRRLPGIDRRPNESTKHMRVPIVAAALFLSSAASATATNPLTMAVSPVHAFAPTTLTIRIRVEPDSDNRALEVVAESSEYYRSSRI